jgi:uncharacterized membrane protein YdjX (TVP38/TMEM64 family)
LRRRVAAFLVLAAAIAWALWSYRSGGVIAAMLASPAEGEDALSIIRDYVLGWGALAPIAYVVAVTVEVVVAPIPGAILYAPGGAIFGGFIGGTLSLIGNVAGAAIASWLGATFGADWVANKAAAGNHSALSAVHARLVARGGWLVFVLRVNPLTSSDLVSYAAGLAGVPVRHVALGTLFGMAPLCYAQAYLAESLFQVLPGNPAALMVAAVVAAVVVTWFMLRATNSRD